MSDPVLTSGFLVDLAHSAKMRLLRRHFLNHSVRRAVRTMVQNKQESRRTHWTTRSSVRSFARTAYSPLLASLAYSAAALRSLIRLGVSVIATDSCDGTLSMYDVLVLLEEQAKLLASVLESFFIAFLFFRLVLF